MENKKMFEAKELKNVKEIIYESAKKYSEKIAFVINGGGDYNHRIDFINMYIHYCLLSCGWCNSGI